MNKYTLSYRFLNGNVHGCVFAKNRQVSLNWTDIRETYLWLETQWSSICHGPSTPIKEVLPPSRAMNWNGLHYNIRKNKGTHYFPQSSKNSIPVNIPDYIVPSIRQDHTAEHTSKSAPTMNSTIIAFCQELMPSCLTWGG